MTDPNRHPASGGAGLGSFFVLSYAITWLILGPWFYAFNGVLHRKLPWWAWVILPILILGGWGPSVAAVICAWREGGRPALAPLWRSLALWRVPVGWYALILVLPIALTAMATFLSSFGAAARHDFDAVMMLRSVPLAFLSALPFGPGEELGWRGYALPRLLRSLDAWRASLLLGIAWTFWHLPMIVLMPGAALPEFMPASVGAIGVYLVRTVAICGIMTFVYLHTRASVLLAVLLHLTFNTSEAVFFSGLPNPSDDQLHEVYLINVALLCAVSAALLTRLSRKSG